LFTEPIATPSSLYLTSFINLKIIIMKKIFMNNRIIAIAFMTVFSAALTPAMANGTNPVLPVEIKYVGKIQNNPVFQLSVAGNGTQDDFTINIKDEYGNSLHMENIKGDSFTKKFMLAIEELGDYSIQIQVTSRKNKSTVSYAVNSNTRNVQEVIVNQL
jgi:hypothetical protein